jgi:hypothetical protein
MIQGIFASNQNIVGDRVGDFSSVILRMQPTGTALFLALSSGMNKAAAADTVFTWFEDSHQSGRSTLTGGGTTTTLTLDDASYYVPGTVAMIEETGEHVLVAGTNANQLTVVRGLGGTAITAVTADMHFQAIGNAHEEGSGMPVAKVQQGAPRFNYVQIFRNSWAITGTAKAVATRTGNKLARNKKDCASFHAEDMERAFVWGRSHVGTYNNKQFRMTDGIVAQVEKYGGVVESVATGGTPGDYSRVDFEDFIRRIFATSIKGQPNERMAMGGDQVVQVLNQMTMLDGTYNISVGETKVGISVTEIMTPFGKLKLMTHPLMNENPVWQKELYVLHPGAIRKRTLRETNEEGYDENGKRIQGKDADEGVITTEAGIEVGGARTMGILRNVTRAVKSTAG